MSATDTKSKVNAVNVAFRAMSIAMVDFNDACKKNASPIRCVTYRVDQDGNTKLHVTYKRK